MYSISEWHKHNKQPKTNFLITTQNDQKDTHLLRLSILSIVHGIAVQHFFSRSHWKTLTAVDIIIQFSFSAVSLPNSIQFKRAALSSFSISRSNISEFFAFKMKKKILIDFSHDEANYSLFLFHTKFQLLYTFFGKNMKTKRQKAHHAHSEKKAKTQIHSHIIITNINERIIKRINIFIQT